ncbi:MAG: gliding motility-associated C-terminal domain-containing protein [Cytophagaceae bacterium]
MNEGSTGNLIGGVNANQPNTINNNAGNGVNILDATSNQNSIHRNSIFCNTARGIELNGVGNNNYAAPTFSRNGDGFIVLTGPAGSTIEVFMLTPSPCVECNEGTEGSNQLQGRTFHMSGASPLVTNITDERLITATASAANTTTAHNTSEFTPCTILCLPPVEATSASAPESICSATGGNITLTAEGGEGGAEGVFRWYANGCGTGTAVASGLVAEIAAPTTTTTYYGRWENECGDSECVSTQVQVIPNPNPFDIEFNSPISLCDTYAELTVNPVQEGVTYRWTRNGEDMGETGPTIDVYQGGTYSVIATGVDELCSTEANEAVDFSIVERPDNFTIEADGPIIFCSGNNVTLSVNPVQDGVTYHWRRNGSVYAEPGTSVSVNQAGTYRAFASFGHECITDSDNTVEITVHPNPNSFNIAADGDLIFCDGESINLSVSPAQTGISYQWTRNGANFGTPATSVNVTEAGVYNVVATGTGECTTEANATAEVIVNPNPNDFDINAAGPTTFCEGGSVNLSVSPFQGSITYQWIRDGVNIEQGTSISATQSGTYNVIASSGQACTTEADATVTVTVNENPTASITPPGDASACEGGSVELTSGGTGNRTWFRNTVLIDGETGISYNASQEGSYTVRITNPTTGCFAEATTNVTILENNFAGIAFPDGNSFCEGNDLTVNATPTNGTSYTWTLNGNPIAGDGNSISATLPGVYRVEIVLDGGCTDDAEAEVFMNENPPAFDVIADGDIVFCDGEDVTLSVNPATAGITYAWFNGADPLINGTSLVVSTSGTYTVIGTSAEECTTDANNSVEVTVNDNPDDFVVSPGGEVIFCEGGDVELQIIEIQDGITYTWTNGTDTWTGPTLTVNESGTYTATGSSSANCTTDAGNSAEVTVNPNPPAFEITADGDIIFCDGDDVTLNITPSVDGITYTWYRVDEELTAGINLLVSESGTYTAIASSGEECTTDADNSVEVTVNDNPDDFVVSPGGEVIFCEGGDVELQIIDVQDGITYTWTNGTDTWTGPTLTVNESGTYTATGSSSANCTTDAGNSADVTVNPNPPAFEITADGDIIFCDGEDVTLNITPSVDGITYTWYRVDEELTAGINLLVSESGTYTAIASSAEECTTDADNSVDVAVNDRPDAAVIVGDGTVCENTTGVDFTVQNPNAEYTYAWGISGADIASGEDSPAIVVDFGDGIGVVTITVMVTNTDTGCEADDEASANVIVNARPGALDINGPEEVCNSSTHSYTVSPVTSNSTYTWSTLTGSSVSSGAGSGTVQINFSVDAESGDISVVETNEAGCQTLVPSELAVAILQRPSGGTVAGPQSICANDQDLTYEVDGRPETSVYSWTFPSGVTVISDPANERSINVNFGSTAGNVSVLETIEYDNISCAALAPLTRAVSIRPRPQMSLSGPGNVCAGSTETYSVGPSSMTFEVWEIDTDAASNVTITPNGNNTSYQINFNGTNAPDYVTTVETIHIRVEGNGDCETNDAREMTVSIYPRPRLRDENDWTVRACSDAEVQLEVEAYHGSGGNYVYRWNTLEGLSDSTIANPVAITPVSRTYHVTAWDELDPSGYCPVTQSVYIEITSPVVLLYPPNMHICEDDSKQVRVSIVGQDGTDLTDDPDRYDVTWTAGSVGSPLSNLSSVNELEPMVTPANPGNFHYVLEINDNLSACIITRNLFVRSTHNPRVELNRSADTVCAKSPVDLTGSVNWQYPVYYPDSLTYLWYLNDTTDTELFNGARRDTNNVTINPEQHRATYYLVVQDYYGCRGYDTTVVHSIDQQELVIPNLFTPNGDNLNDTYVIRDVNGFQMFDGARMDVYNRWGKLVYRTEHYDNTWDGTDLSDGVYYYNLQPSCGEKSYKGWVQIMR